MIQLREELYLAAAEGRLSSPEITFQQSQALPYLQACIKEALRLYPATGLPLARVVPKGGVTFSGRFFPEGVSVSRTQPLLFGLCLFTLLILAILGDCRC